jgi:hypothetical protein
MSFDPASDFVRVVDGAQRVAFRRRGAAAGADDTTIDHALRSAATSQDIAQSNGRYLVGDAVWRLPSAELAASPAAGDLIIDGDGGRWTILEVQSLAQGTCWRCAARQARIAHGLDDTVTILKASVTKGDGGATVRDWQVWKTGVRARIQPLEAAPCVEGEAQRTASRFRVILAENAALDHTHRIQGPDGNIYRIMRVANAEQLGEPQTVEVEEVQ